MVDVRVVHALTDQDRSAIAAFLHDAHVDDCAQLNDHLSLDLAHGPADGFVAVQAWDGSRMVAYAQASAAQDGFVVDSIVWSGIDADQDETRLTLLRTVLDAVPVDAGITWWTHDPHTAEPLADALGLAAGRALLQMRRPLPVEDALDTARDVAVRPFVVGRDETAWLEVNNAAFAWHGEQGGWDLARLEQREQEDWFRPDGFLLHDRDGRLAAFCWTKLHPSPDGLVGEIYVIAVHPDFHGLGLGRGLTLAGLRSLHEAGATEGMLYVDAGNTSAVGLYRALGFEVAHTDQAYTRPSRNRLP
ncbi:MAG: mycothiol synthase [Ilumatobacteraceae bacterium]